MGDGPDVAGERLGDAHAVVHITRKGGKASTESLSPIVLRALEDYVGDRTTGPSERAEARSMMLLLALVVIIGLLLAVLFVLVVHLHDRAGRARRRAGAARARGLPAAVVGGVAKAYLEAGEEPPKYGRSE